MCEYTINGLKITNLTAEEWEKLLEMKRKRRRKGDKYKIHITTDRRDYDDLSELADHPERGIKVGIFCFNNPDQLDLILKAFEGHFYQLFELATDTLKGYGVVDDLVYEGWWDDECPGVCESCFLRIDKGTGYYECMRGDR